MATLLELCNQALSSIGARSTIASLGENSKEAQTCNLWTTSVRHGLLRAAHWGFARKQVNLTELGELSVDPPTSPFPWQFTYDYPTDCIRLRYLLVAPPSDAPSVVTGDSLWYNPWLMPSRSNRFLVAADPGLGTPATAGRVVLSNIEDAIAVYTGDVTDPEHWDKGFEDAFVSEMASKIVIPLTGNVGMKQTFHNLAGESVMYARATDGNEALPSADHTPDWISARQGGTYGPALEAMGMWYQGWDTQAWGA